MNTYFKAQKGLTVGNHSKDAASWICGPNHQIRDQRVPGYTGFISGVHAENVYSKSYSRCVAKSLAGKIKKGFDQLPKDKYKTQQQQSFGAKNFRRIMERPELESQKDYIEYSQTLNV